MIRGLTVLLALCVLLVIPSTARAGVVTLTDYNLGNAHFLTNAAGGGGPFKASTTGAELGVAEFVTFCIEFSEHFSYGGTYNFTLSDAAVNGGVAGGNPDPVSDATKWLYYQVVSGGYASMYTPVTGLALSNDVGANFQNAIWYLEQERTEAQIGGPTSAGSLLAQHAIANQAAWLPLLAAGNRVYAMNLTDVAGNRYQDQLAYTAVPEPGSLILLAAGLLAASRTFRSRRGRGAQSDA